MIVVLKHNVQKEKRDQLVDWLQDQGLTVVLKHHTEKEKRMQLVEWLQSQGLTVHISEGDYQTVLGLVGDTSRVDMALIESLNIVDSVKRITDPFKKSNRKFHPDDTIVEVGDVKVGKGNFVVIAGPCSVETEEQIVTVAKAVKAAGADMLRGGSAGGRPALAGDREGRNRIAPGHRVHGRGRPAPVRERGRHPDRRAQHAELRAAEGRRQAG